MATFRVCDRCNRKEKRHGEIHVVKLSMPSDRACSIDRDLCTKCYEEIKKSFSEVFPMQGE